MMMHSDAAGAMGAVFAALFVAHQVADHWVQTARQSTRKALPGRAGWAACTGHVATYTATAVVLLAPTLALLVAAQPARVVAGLAISAVTHWVIDRRRPLLWLATRLGRAALLSLGVTRPGRDDLVGPGTGLYTLDQSAHYLFLLVAALVMVA